MQIGYTIISNNRGFGAALQPDPIMQSPLNAQNHNRYAYCFNNPISFSDPSGMVAEGDPVNFNYIGLPKLFTQVSKDVNQTIITNGQQQSREALMAFVRVWLGQVAADEAARVQSQYSRLLEREMQLVLKERREEAVKKNEDKRKSKLIWGWSQAEGVYANNISGRLTGRDAANFNMGILLATVHGMSADDLITTLASVSKYDGGATVEWLAGAFGHECFQEVRSENQEGGWARYYTSGLHFGGGVENTIMMNSHVYRIEDNRYIHTSSMFGAQKEYTPIFPNSLFAISSVSSEVFVSDAPSQVGKDDTGVRAPDFYSLNITIAIPNPLTATVIGWSGSISIDRHGQIFMSPFGVSVGKSALVASGSLTANWMLQSNKPIANETYNFLSGHGISVGGGWIGGANWTISPTNSGTNNALGLGFYTPQVGASYNYTPEYLIFNKK